MILPVIEDRDTGPFFAASAEERLVFAECEHCGRGSHPPMPFCAHCHQPRTAWRDASGRGTLHAFTVVTHGAHPDFPVPYTLVLVTLDDNPDVRMIGSMAGAQALDIGQAMTVWFDRRSDDVVLPQWRPA